MTVAQGLAAAIFAVTFLLLALGRFAHVPLHRGPVALAGGLLTAVLLNVSWRVIDPQILLLLAGLMALAGLAEACGLFAGLRRSLRRMSPALSLWVSLLVMALTSALLLNDAAVVVLVPLLLPVLLGRGLPAVPVVALLAVAANLGSLLTPYGNPQNAVVARAAGLGVLDFLAAQGPLVLLGLLLLAAPSWWLGRNAQPLPESATVPLVHRGRPWLVACIAGFAVAAAAAPQLGLGTLAVLVAVLALLGVVPVAGRGAAAAALRAVDGNVLLLFVGLYLLTGGLPQWLPPTWLDLTSLDAPAPAAVLVAVLSNSLGNVPAVLALLRLDEAWVVGHASFLVTTSTLGGALLLTGSAASLIAADQARRLGVEVRFLPFLVHAAWALPLLVVGAWWTWP